MTPSLLAGISGYRRVGDALSTSGQPTEAQLRAIAEAGFTAVINLALHDDPRYSLADEAGAVRALGMAYTHIPVRFDAPTHEDLERFFNAMDAARGECLWVHCAANMRVSAFLGLYRALRLSWDEDEAFALMREIWRPDEIWRSFIAGELERGKARLPGR